jgi:hypothetical protein
MNEKVLKTLHLPQNDGVSVREKMVAFFEANTDNNFANFVFEVAEVIAVRLGQAELDWFLKQTAEDNFLHIDDLARDINSNLPEDYDPDIV